MTAFQALPVSGCVETSVIVNLRQNAPNTSAPVVRKLPAKTRLQVTAVVVGQVIGGNPHWYDVGNNSYVWAGGCTSLELMSRPLPGAGTSLHEASAELPPQPLMAFSGFGRPLTQAGLDAALTALNIDAPTLWAIIFTESSGCGFMQDRRPKILFERHYFNRLTGGKWGATHPDVSASIRGGYAGCTSCEYLRLETAMQLDVEAALQSTSWGAGQTLGYYYKAAGFDSVRDLVDAYISDEDKQLAGMVSFINGNALDSALRRQDWGTFACRYNGPHYAEQCYDRQLAAYHGTFSNQGVPDITVRACQMYLKYRHYYPGLIDGVSAKSTTQAARDFQMAAGLNATGVADQALLSALAKQPL